MTMKMSQRLPCEFPAIIIGLSVWGSTAAPAIANHGPGTSGGGSATASGETLKQGSFDLSLREDYTQFEHITRAGAERRALKSGEFDALERSYLTTGATAYGITDEFQAGAQI